MVKNPNSSYIRTNDLPKLAALKRVWPQFWRENPVLLARSQDIKTPSFAPGRSPSPAELRPSVAGLARGVSFARPIW